MVTRSKYDCPLCWIWVLMGLQMAVEADPWSTYFGAVWAGESDGGWWWWSPFLSLLAVLSSSLCNTAEFHFMTSSSFLHRFLLGAPVQCNLLPVARCDMEFPHTGFDTVFKFIYFFRWLSPECLSWCICPPSLSSELFIRTFGAVPALSCACCQLSKTMLHTAGWEVAALETKSFFGPWSLKAFPEIGMVSTGRAQVMVDFRVDVTF